MTVSEHCGKQQINILRLSHDDLRNLLAQLLDARCKLREVYSFLFHKLVFCNNGLHDFFLRLL